MPILTDYTNLGGWIDDPVETERVMKDMPFPIMDDCYSSIKDSGKDKTVLLYDFVKKVTGSHQVQVQKIGDCVSFGAAHAIQALICTEIALKKEKEKWVGQVCTESIYGGSRVQIGNGRLGSGDGSLGAWAAKFITDYGVLSRLVYGDYDLRQYSPTRAKQWGMPRVGCPRELWDDCREHPVGTATKVTSVEQARDLIANGYAIGIAGNKGFSNRRDKYGIARASGSWSHMMSILGVDDDGSTAGGKKTMLVCNSWPYNWISGPTRFDQPPGSFWATYDDLEYYFVRGDSWAYSNFQGYPARPAYNIDIF